VSGVTNVLCGGHDVLRSTHIINSPNDQTKSKEESANGMFSASATCDNRFHCTKRLQLRCIKYRLKGVPK
jgi:hypothetical protein